MTKHLLLPYQNAWLSETANFAVIEKCRRAGISWAQAGRDALHAGHSNGGNVWYMGQDKDMSQAYITDAAWWADEVYGSTLKHSDIEQDVLEDGDNSIMSYKIRFASGFKITALSSRPANLRSKGRVGDRFTFDEAAYHPDFAGLMKAAGALLMWGCKVRIISTHNGADNPFNELVQDIRSGEQPGKVHRIDFQEAIRQGLYKRICAVTGKKWTRKAEQDWMTEIYRTYRHNAAEELDVIPSQSSGVWLPRALIEARMTDCEVIEVKQ